MAEIIVYGIPNCDSTKKVMDWFKKNKILFTFHNYKEEGISKQKLEVWCYKQGWELIFSKRSTSWRTLTELEQKKIDNPSAAIKVMMETNSIIKRPIVEYGNKLILGFKEADYKGLFKITNQK